MLQAYFYWHLRKNIIKRTVVLITQMNDNYGAFDIILFLVVNVLLIFIVILIWINNIVPFLEKCKYIKMEIKRSADDDRCRYWKNELKKLYLHSMPIIGRFFR